MGMLKLWIIEIDRIIRYSNLIYFRYFQRHKFQFRSNNNKMAHMRTWGGSDRNIIYL